MAHRKINVSRAIKEYLAANPKDGPTAAAKAVSGIVGKKVTATYVSNIKSNMKKGKRRGPKARMRRAASLQNGSIDLAALMAMKELLGRCGADACHKMIDVLA